MADALVNTTPHTRAEREFQVTVPQAIGDVERPLGFFERLWGSSAVRRGVILILLAAVWEAYARWSDSPLLFPTFTDTVQALWSGIVSGVIPQRLWVTLQILGIGYGIGCRR
jgi:NitT/TauT family transport system permease protein